jgi:hypothetical protein
MSISGLAITLSRRKAIDYTTGLVDNVNGLIIKKTGAVAINYFVYVEVFLDSLWIGIWVIMLLLMAGEVKCGSEQLYKWRF